MNFLKRFWWRWLAVSKTIGNFQGQVILSIFYLVILFPLGIIFRFFADVLKLNAKHSSFVRWEHKKETLDEARRQY